MYNNDHKRLCSAQELGLIPRYAPLDLEDTSAVPVSAHEGDQYRGPASGAPGFVAYEFTLFYLDFRT